MDLYDAVGGLLGMDLYTEIVEFSTGEKSYRLQLWKGSYGQGQAYGGEIGCYTSEDNSGWYETARGEDEIWMEQKLYDKLRENY